MTAMNDSPRALLKEMESKLKEAPLGEEKSLAPAYAARIKAVGEISLLTVMFCELQDARLTEWLLRLAFFWKDLSFENWRQILYRIASNNDAFYQFAHFAGTFLAIDVGALLQLCPDIDDTSYRRFVHEYPEGAPRPSNWESEALAEDGVDCGALWRRLAAEGAPMNIHIESNEDGVQ